MKFEMSVSLTYALGVVGAILIALITIPPDNAVANVDGWLRLIGLPGLSWPSLAAAALLIALNATILGLFMLWLRPKLYAQAQADLWAAMQCNISEPRPVSGV